MKFKSMRDPEVVTLENDPFDRVYKDLPAHHHVLRKVPICEYCGAIRFRSEGSGFYCRQGKVNIVNTPIPDEHYLPLSDSLVLYTEDGMMVVGAP